MCATCGCSDHGQAPAGDHAHGHQHHHGPAARLLALERAVLERNDRAALENRARLRAGGILALNLVSSPGAGKTTLLERMIREIGREYPLFVIEGDQETSTDAERIRAAGGRALQINTGRACHLDATMIGRALSELGPPPGALLLIENVGNLVCPALFDLGEHAKVVVASVPEGDDKPVKYPYMFRASEVLLLNKIDLLPHVAFDVERCVARARAVNPRLRTFAVSALRGDGLEAWYGWVHERVAECRAVGG